MDGIHPKLKMLELIKLKKLIKWHKLRRIKLRNEIVLIVAMIKYHKRIQEGRRMPKL